MHSLFTTTTTHTTPLPTTTTTNTPTTGCTNTTTSAPRFLRDGPKQLFTESSTLKRSNDMTNRTSSPGAAKRIPGKMPGLLRTTPGAAAAAAPNEPTNIPNQRRYVDQGAMGSLIDEVDRKLCKGVQHNLLRICELYAKSRSVTSLSDEEANMLRNEITELFSDVSRMEKSAIQNYKKKGIKRRRRRTIQLTSENKVSKSCASCGTTTTSQWRRGNSQMLVLCNPCGLRFKRQEKEKAGLLPSSNVSTPMSTPVSSPPLPMQMQMQQDKGRINFLLNEPDLASMNLGGEARP